MDLRTLGRSLGTWMALAAATAAQTPVPAVDPALPAKLKDLKAMVADKKMAEDFRAIGIVQTLAEKPGERNPKDVERIAKALGDVFRTGKVRPPDKDHLYRETADALAKLGEEGAKELFKAATDARFKDYVPLRAHLMLALGRTEDPKQVDWLCDEAVRSPHDEIRAAGGEALGFFTSLDEKPRRDVVKALIREWGGLHSRATQLDPAGGAAIDPDADNARRTLRAIEGKWSATLGKLTGAGHTTLADWQYWLNKNPNWPIPPAPKKA
jgi:hypothetical protein